SLLLSFSSFAQKAKKSPKFTGGRPEGTLYRPPAKSLGEKAFEYEFLGRLFQTTGVYDVDGTEFALNEGESNTVYEGDMILRYGFSEALQFSGGIRVRQISQQYDVGTETISATNSGAESYHFQLKYSLRSSKRLFYSLNLDARQTAYSNTTYNSASEIPSDEIVLGDSGATYGLGVSLSFMRTPSHYLNATVAYRQPGNELSAEAPYDINTVWAWSSVAMELGVEGIYTFGGDEFGNSPGLKKPQGRGSSGLYNSINRQWMAPKASLFYAFGSGWRIGVQASQVIAGQSTDKGVWYTLSLKKTSSPKRTKVSNKKEAFKEYNIEGTVLKVSPRGKFIQIDQGLSQDVEKGMVFDIYQTDFFGGNELVASAVAYEVGVSKSILRLAKVYSNKRVKKGFVARAQ
ncbi:MAG: hypothetical protein NXH75_11410, partial [Halobacteriovoraceae bacterium]|nr:hypothetical protein [Halobacteriovoraceae bacterium]